MLSDVGHDLNGEPAFKPKRLEQDTASKLAIRSPLSSNPPSHEGQRSPSCCGQLAADHDSFELIHFVPTPLIACEIRAGVCRWKVISSTAPSTSISILQTKCAENEGKAKKLKANFEEDVLWPLLTQPCSLAPGCIRRACAMVPEYQNIRGESIIFFTGPRTPHRQISTSS